MKIKKMIYVDEEVDKKLRRISGHQSELINAILADLFEARSEEEIVAYRIKHGSYRGIICPFPCDEVKRGG